MKLHNLLTWMGVFAAALFLAGCQTTQREPVSTVRVITDTEQLRLPRMTAPPDTPLVPFQYTAPSDPKAVVALDQPNLNILKKNFYTLKAREQKWRSRMHEFNRLQAATRTKP